jgi:pimeloyl-ACP methyl ester carboxylesterase
MEPSGFCEILGNCIAEYRSGRPGANVALVFVHGNSSSTRAFEHQFSAFGDLELLGFDLPGHGASHNAAGQDSYSLKCYAEIVKHQARSVQARRVLLIGWSLGGHIVLEALNESNAATAALIVGAPPLRSMADMADAFLRSSALELIQRGPVSEAEAKVWAQNCTCLGANYPEWLKTDFQRTDPVARIGLITSLASGAFKDEWREVQAAKMPVALIVGGNDPFINKDFLRDASLLTNVRDSRVEIISSAGHMAQWDAPVEFNEILADCVHELRQSSG